MSDPTQVFDDLKKEADTAAAEFQAATKKLEKETWGVYEGELKKVDTEKVSKIRRKLLGTP